MLEQIATRHRGHVPVGNHQAISLGPHLGERSRPVGRVVDVVEAELRQELSQNAHHRAVVVDDKNREVGTHPTSSAPGPAPWQTMPALNGAMYRGVFGCCAFGRIRTS